MKNNHGKVPKDYEIFFFSRTRLELLHTKFYPYFMTLPFFQILRPFSFSRITHLCKPGS